jgi:hypothetical protein
MAIFWVSFAAAVVIIGLFTVYMVSASRRERGMVDDEHHRSRAQRRQLAQRRALRRRSGIS